MSTGQDRGLPSPVSRPLSPAGASCRPNPTKAGGQGRGGVRREPDGRAKSTGPAEHPCNLGSLAHNVFKVEARKLKKQTNKKTSVYHCERDFIPGTSLFPHFIKSPVSFGRGALGRRLSSHYFVWQRCPSWAREHSVPALVRCGQRASGPQLNRNAKEV